MLGRIYFFVFLSSCFYSNSQSLQQTRKDFYQSDKNLLKNASILRDNFLDESPDSIYTLGLRLINKGIDQENLAFLNYGKLVISSYYYEHGKPEISLENLSSCLRFYERKRDYENMADVQNMMGLALIYQAKNKEAISWFVKSMESANLLEDDNESFMAQKNMADALYNLEEYDSAEKEIKGFMQKVEKLHLNKGLRKAYDLLGKICFATDRISEGIEYYRKSLNLAYKNGDKLGLSFALNNMAIAHFQEGKDDKARISFEKSLHLRKEMGNFPVICESYFNLGEYYFYVENYQKARLYYDSCKLVAQNNKLFTEQADALERIAECFQKESQFEKAYESMLLFGEVKSKLIKHLQQNESVNNEDYKNYHENEKLLMQTKRERTLTARIKEKERNATILGITSILLFIFLTIITIKGRKARLPE